MMPALFLSHGAPAMVIDDVLARDFLRRLANDLPRPESVIVVSAHWDTPLPTVNAVMCNETISDLPGVQPERQALAYPAPGSVALAERVTDLLAAQGLACRIDTARGLDHGASMPMMQMYPAHDIPVIQLSLQSRLGPGHHFQLGKALAPLRQDGVLIVGSGSLACDGSGWIGEFAQWLDAALMQGRICDLMSWRTRAPHAARAHPTDQHLLPLFVAVGAGTGGHARPSASHLHSISPVSASRIDAYAFS